MNTLQMMFPELEVFENLYKRSKRSKQRGHETC